MHRRLTVAGFTLSIFIWTGSAHAQATRSVSASDARGEHQIVSLELYQGYSVTLNFRPVQAIIRRAWLDNPSQLTLDFDDPRCADSQEPENCAATVIHLRRINPLQFPNLPSTGATMLTVLTDTELYKFQLIFPSTGSPTYYIVDIQPNRFAPSSALTAESQMRGPQRIHLINRGLQIAHSRRLIAQEDPLWNRIQTFLHLLRDGTPMAQAARQAGISQALVMRLINMGQHDTASE